MAKMVLGLPNGVDPTEDVYLNGVSWRRDGRYRVRGWSFRSAGGRISMRARLHIPVPTISTSSDGKRAKTERLFWVESRPSRPRNIGIGLSSKVV